MIICPSCKEQIEDNSYYCDQCGQALLYCDRCGRVGIGRRGTQCGGLMVPAEGSKNGAVSSVDPVSQTASSRAFAVQPGSVSLASQGVPTLLLYNTSLDIRIQGINGAVIGRRQGPYAQQFEGNMYISGVHAQLKYSAYSGWCIIDKHSSNGTKLNQHPIQPDVEMSLKNGDIVALANINLQVIIN